MGAQLRRQQVPITLEGKRLIMQHRHLLTPVLLEGKRRLPFCHFFMDKGPGKYFFSRKEAKESEIGHCRQQKQITQLHKVKRCCSNAGHPKSAERDKDASI